VSFHSLPLGQQSRFRALALLRGKELTTREFEQRVESLSSQLKREGTPFFLGPDVRVAQYLSAQQMLGNVVVVGAKYTLTELAEQRLVAVNFPDL
jgi:thiamine monophosphate synthase